MQPEADTDAHSASDDDREAMITRTLEAAATGDGAAASQLLPLIYEQLRRAAQLQMADERRDHTLSATALVHEAFARVAGDDAQPWAGRGHLYKAVAQAMRQVLIDHARARATLKRGGAGNDGDARVARAAALDLGCLPELTTDQNSAGFLILDDAISRLEQVDAQAAEVVRLKFFAGCTNEQAAQTLGVSAPTVKRAWAFARGWLKTAIEQA